jgi:uncharacterized protein (TIGR02453 family)
MRSPFGPGLLRFLRELERNNRREWFQANKERYEAEVREPALVFIRAMERHLHRISKHVVASDRKVGGSLMRVHRDVRFSKDKRPYKTNLGIQFRHEAGKDVHAPGFYFHVDPSSVFLGAGSWHPEKTALAAYRESIDDDPKAWKRVRDGNRFRQVWEFAGASLKRPPRGYPADHPMIEDLKRTDLIAICRLKVNDVTRTDLVERTAGLYRRAKGLMAWQATALGLPF